MLADEAMSFGNARMCITDFPEAAHFVALCRSPYGGMR